MNTRTLKAFFFALLLGLPACSEVDPQPGQEGGACRVSLEPCDPGLLCFGGGCHPPPGGDETTVGVQWSFPLMGKDVVEADGVDSLVVQASLFDLNTGEPMPQNFGFRMWVEPAGNGTLEVLRDFNPLDAEGRWSLLDDQGRAFARFTGCDKQAADCFRYATIRIAVEPRLLAPIDQITIENLGARLPTTGGAGGAGGGGGAGGAGGGNPLPALDCTANKTLIRTEEASFELNLTSAVKTSLSDTGLSYSFEGDAGRMDVLLSTIAIGPLEARDYTSSLNQIVASVLFVAEQSSGLPCTTEGTITALSVGAFRHANGTLQEFKFSYRGECPVAPAEVAYVSGCLWWKPN